VEENLGIWSMHRITQHANTFNADLDDIAGDERANTCGGAGGDQVARIKSHHARDPADEERDGVNHQRSVAGLTEGPVDAGFDKDVQRMELGCDMRTNGTKGVKALGARELPVALLNVAGGYIVEASVAKQVTEGIVAVSQMRTAAADNESELAFMLDILRVGREDDGLFGADDGRGRLEKNERLFGNLITTLGGMGGVVAPDAYDFSRINWREKPNIDSAPRARSLRPSGPRGARNLMNPLALEETIERSFRSLTGRSTGEKAAKSHSRSARAVIGVRSM